MRQSDQQDGARPSRPTSILTHLDISGPLPYENGQRSASSPTHALLPHVDTSQSVLSTVVSDKTQKECALSSDENVRHGGEGSSLFGSLAAGLEKSRSKLRSKSMSIRGSSNKDNVPDSPITAAATTNEKSTKRSFMESLAKSISLPSPKIRGVMKSHTTTHGSTKAQYEITVEHQEPRKDSGDHSPPILTPCDTTKVFPSADAMSNSMTNSSKDSIDSIKPTQVEVKKVDTTVSVTNASNLITGSKSLSSFCSSNRVTSPLYRTTLPASKSYSFRASQRASPATSAVISKENLVSNAFNKLSSPTKSIESSNDKSKVVPLTSKHSSVKSSEDKTNNKDPLEDLSATSITIKATKDKEVSSPPPSYSSLSTTNNNLQEDTKES